MNAQSNVYNTVINASFDARINYEAAKNASNTSMQKTLSDLKKSVSHERITDIMSACDVDANFINTEARVDSRFNVYAAEKVINIARFIAHVQSLNHYTLAIVKTMQSFEAEQMQMTHEEALAACSLKIRCKDTKRAKFVVRYEKHVEASTASTQASSSLNALKMYHLISETRDVANQRCYTLNRENLNTLAMLDAIA